MLGYWVYLLASRRNGTLYVGVTRDLVRRVAEHRERVVPGFTAKYGVTRLVWFETEDAIEASIRREKRLKKWPRAWQVALIGRANLKRRDLWAEVTGAPGQAGRRPGRLVGRRRPTASAPPDEPTPMRWMARSSGAMTGWGTGWLGTAPFGP
jgi:putative endonuclease